MKHSLHNQLSYWIGLLLLAACCGCSKTEDGSIAAHVDGAANDNVARSHQKAEKIELTVEVSPANLRLSDELLMTLTIRKQENVQIKLPSMEEALADFTIRDVQNPLPKLDGEFQVIQQLYRLEPVRDGKLTIIPPAVIYFADIARDEKDPPADSYQIIEVEPLEIQVTTELASQLPNLDQLRPENPPIELPAQRPNFAVWIALLAVAISLLAVFISLYATKRSKAAQQLSPRELARIELQKLVEANWSKLDPKRYFVELTGIVRRFIERTTGVRAPEQTTEEFLREIAGDRLFGHEVQQRLREFLESADLVKFAGLKPSEQDIPQSLDRAERFIESELVQSSATLAVPTTAPRVELDNSEKLSK